MDCKILDRANKRLAQQHEEIEELQEQLEKARERYTFQEERTIHFADMADRRREDMNVLRAERDELQEQIEGLQRQIDTLRGCNRFLIDQRNQAQTALIEENVKLKGEVRRLEQLVLRKNVELEEKRLAEAAKWQDERQAVASDALRWLDERDEARKEIVTLRAKLDVALWKLGNGRAEMATAVAKTNGLRKIVAKCYTFFATFSRRERDEETHARIQDAVEDLFLVCHAALGISQAEEADDEL